MKNCHFFAMLSRLSWRGMSARHLTTLCWQGNFPEVACHSSSWINYSSARLSFDWIVPIPFWLPVEEKGNRIEKNPIWIASNSARSSNYFLKFSFEETNCVITLAFSEQFGYFKWMPFQSFSPKQNGYFNFARNSQPNLIYFLDFQPAVFFFLPSPFDLNGAKGTNQQILLGLSSVAYGRLVKDESLL